METRVKDGFPFGELECKFYEVCKYYTPKYCDYAQPCPARVSFRSTSDLGFEVYISVRKFFRDAIEPDYSNSILELQIQWIIDEIEGGEDE